MSAPAPRREDLPDGSIRLHFAAPILLHDEPKRFLTLRQPTVAELLDIGDPVTWVYDMGGRGTRVVERDMLRRWIVLLLSDHDLDFVGTSRDLSLGLLIEDAVTGFFQSARTRLQTASAPSSAAA